MPDPIEIVLYAVGAVALVSIIIGGIAWVSNAIRNRQRRKQIFKLTHSAPAVGVELIMSMSEQMVTSWLRQPFEFAKSGPSVVESG
jgi:hypothetical protein